MNGLPIKQPNNLRLWHAVVQEGFMLSYMHKRVPYIVRNARELHHITQGLLVSALLRNTSMTLNG